MVTNIQDKDFYFFQIHKKKEHKREVDDFKAIYSRCCVHSRFIRRNLSPLAKGFMALPVGVYEMSLSAWLIVKGFQNRNLERLKVK